jgi:alpha-D-ribose 1-methylphosphonate 5-triphosphate synthase subunit PhnI
MSDRQMSQTTLLDELAHLDPKARRHLATTLRRLSETFAEVPDGQKAGYVLGVLARVLDFA